MASQNSGILLSSGTNEVEFIEFYLAGESYGINVSKVQKVIELKTTKITTMLGARESVLGTFHLQEKPVALIDLPKALRLPAKSKDSVVADARKLILVARFNSVTTGYVIDGIHKIHRTSWQHFQPMGEGFGSGGQLGGYTTGTIEMDGRVILILDLERLMLDFNPIEVKPEDAIEEPEMEVRTSREQLHVVYAEDSRIVRKMTEDVLRKAGFTNLKSFENGERALEHVMERKKQADADGQPLRNYIDIIITDIEMPRLDGLSFCKRVNDMADKSHIPSLVVYSSLINREMSAKCKSVGADAELSKPHGEEIVSIIDRLCLGSKQPVPVG